MRLLVVEDSPTIQKAITLGMQSLGVDVVGKVANGEQAVTAYRVLKPDIVSMDLNMPGGGGLQAIRSIKGLDPMARIVVLSSIDDKVSVVEAIEAGAQRYVVKPFDANKLLAAIRSILPEGEMSKAQANVPRLGDLLVEHGLISQQQLDKALGHQSEFGGTLGDNLVNLGFVSRPVVARYVYEQASRLDEAIDELLQEMAT